MKNAELQIVIDAQNNAQKEIKRFQRQVETMHKHVKKNFTAMANIGRTLSRALAGVGTGFVGLATLSVKNAEKVNNALIGLSSVANAFGVDAEEAKKSAQSLSEDGLMSINDAATGLKNLIAASFNLEESNRLMLAFKDAAAFNRQGSLQFGQAIVGATEGLKNQNSILVDNAGITKNLSVILKEAGYSAQDLQNIQSDVNVRQALYNGILKEAAAFQGDAKRSTETLTGSVAMLKTTLFNASAELARNTGLTEASGKVVIQLSQFIAEHKDTIVNSINTIKEKFAEFGPRVVEAVRPMWDVLKKFFTDVENRKPLIITALTIIGVAITAAAVAVIVAAAEITAVIALITAITFTVAKAWDQNWGGIQDKTFAVFNAIKGLWENDLRPTFEVIKKFVRDNKDEWQKSWEAVKKIVYGAWLVISNLVQLLVGSMGNTIRIGLALVRGDFKGAFKYIIRHATFAREKIIGIFRGIGSGISGALRLGLNQAIRQFNRFIKSINRVKMPKWVPKYGGKSAHIGSIPYLATGTNYIPQDTLAYLHKGEAVVPKKYNPYAGGNTTTNNSSRSININIDLRDATITDATLIDKVRQALAQDIKDAELGLI